MLGRRLRARLGRALDSLDPRERAGVVRLLTVTALLPALLLIAHRAVRLPYRSDPVAWYGLAVLTGATLLLYLAYTQYDDPAVRTLRRRARGHEDFPPLPDRPRVSFLLAVKDEVDNVERCVRSMAASDHPDLQIVVVDDGSTDGTGAVLDALAAELAVTVIHLPRNVGKKAALVRACAVADGDVLVFTDSDCVVAPDAVRLCVLAMVRHPELGAVSGHCRALNPGASVLTRVQDVWYEGQFRISKAAESAFGAVSCVSGPLAAFRREAVYNYLPAWAEDRFAGAPFRFATDRQLTGYVLGQAWRGRALKQRHASSPFVAGHDHPERRWLVGYSRSARVWTNVPARWRPFLHQQVRWKKSFIRNLFFTGAFMWRRGPLPALLYYGHALWVLAAPALVFLHLVWAPLHWAAGLTLLYLCGMLLKGCLWGLAFRLDNPGDRRWRYRPLMSLLSCCVLAWLLPYAAFTLRRGIWTRTPA
ncbi:glycosyl transferase [Streptomyces mangrovisoli]|uniref:Hyaluronan synthase n=1 Tax=Streptomyces mangrovisoli TaxID=1428628 RepID=A0A1J4NQ52_9ACTN|nr:glycosyl transferase [Streptomyces mangrovisoli]